MMTDKRASLTLQKAQAQLLALRQSLGTIPQGSPMFGHAQVRATSENYQTRLLQRRQQEAKRQGVQASDSLKATLVAEPAKPNPTIFIKPGPETTSPKQTNVKAYPSMLTAMLSEGLAAPGRVYLLLRHLDQGGRGWLSVDEVRYQLTR